VVSRRAGRVVALSLALAACKPDLSQTASIVGEPRILAVRADPAEAAPKKPVAYTALYVGGAGTIASAQAPIEWAFCNARKPLAELGPVNRQCLQADGDWFVDIGVGDGVGGKLPDVACRQFGPDVPVPKAGEPPGRPVDPDFTGGYYQPVRLLAPGAGGAVIAVSETRLTCGVAGATPEQNTEFQDRYRPNANPAVDSLSLPDGPKLVKHDGGATNSVRAGDRLALRAAWAACPISDVCGDGVCGPDETATACAADCTKPATCTGAERYVVFDPASRSVVDQREGIKVAWFATDGSFDIDSTGRDAADPEPTSDNGWTAPDRAAHVTLWVVLRDDRGGVGWAEYVFDVQ
jgi:hypothetical protein